MSTPSERLFSKAGNIIRKKKRALLDPENAAMLCFLSENLQYKASSIVHVFEAVYDFQLSD